MTQSTPASSKMEAAYVLAPLGVFFLCCQLILCRVARFYSWSNNGLIAFVVEAGDFLPNVLGSIAMGSIPEESSGVVLMLYLIVLNNSVAAYDREKVKLRYLWTGINVARSAYRALNAVAHAKLGSTAKYVGAYAIVTVMIFSYAYCNCIILLASASKRYSEAVVDEHKKKTEDHYESNPSTLEGYGYVVLLEPEITTVDTILAAEAAEGEGEQQGHRDLCLSFSLFQQLFCLYHGVPWYQEAIRQKYRELVLVGLLGGSAARGFRVVEAELAFLHDHIYGGDILWFPGSGPCRVLYYFLKTAMGVAMYIVGLILYLKSDQPRVWVIAPPMLLYLLFDLLQVVFYCRSDRRVVSRMCHCQQYFGWLISVIRWLTPSRNPGDKQFYWLESVGQYSLLEETTPPRDNSSCCGIPYPQTSLYSHNAKPSGPAVPLPASVKLRVAEVLGDTICQVQVPCQVEYAQRFQGAAPNQKIAVILRWHIATSYCQMDLPAEEDNPSRKVAVLLSKYCSYLVAFCPELLPCSVSDTMCTFSNVLVAVRTLVGGMQDNGHRLDMLRNRAQELQPAQSNHILDPGLHLGQQLITQIQNRQHLWEILESIWVKLILSVAPQKSTDDDTYAKRHAKYLAKGGEFVTYLWAMLSHAGILKHSSWPPCIKHGRVVSWANPVSTVDDPAMEQSAGDQEQGATSSSSARPRKRRRPASKPVAQNGSVCTL